MGLPTQSEMCVGKQNAAISQTMRQTVGLLAEDESVRQHITFMLSGKIPEEK
jgi:hypothetical protein